MYTLNDLESDIQKIIQELQAMRATKGHDYSGTEDTLANLRGFGSYGVLVRIGDKFSRLRNFYKTGELQIANEKIEDTMKDLINYSLFLFILWQQENETKSEGKQNVDLTKWHGVDLNEKGSYTCPRPW